MNIIADQVPALSTFYVRALLVQQSRVPLPLRMKTW